MDNGKFSRGIRLLGRVLRNILFVVLFIIVIFAVLYGFKKAMGIDIFDQMSLWEVLVALFS